MVTRDVVHLQADYRGLVIKQIVVSELVTAGIDNASACGKDLVSRGGGVNTDLAVFHRLGAVFEFSGQLVVPV